MFFFIFGMNSHLPASAREGTLGFGYTINELEVCNKLKKMTVCKDLKNPEECNETMNDSDKCVKEIDNWMDDLNNTCDDKISILENCLEASDACGKEKKTLRSCVKLIKRPE